MGPLKTSQQRLGWFGETWNVDPPPNLIDDPRLQPFGVHAYKGNTDLTAALWYASAHPPPASAVGGGRAGTATAAHAPLGVSSQVMMSPRDIDAHMCSCYRRLPPTDRAAIL